MKVNFALRSSWKSEKGRGVGVYTRELLRALHQNYPQDKFTTSQKSSFPTDTDIVHFPFFDPYFRTLPMSFPRPTVITIHDLIPLKYPSHFPAGIKGKLKWLLQKHSAARSAHLITDSMASKKDIMHFLNVAPGLISVIPLGPTCGALVKHNNASVRARYNLPNRYLLYVGDINWNKNLLGLIKTFASLKDPDLHLVLVGKALGEAPAIPEYHAIKNAIDASGKSALIHILGYVPEGDLPNIYHQATLYVQPSYDEGFGLNLLDAFAAGCPVASSNRGSLPEVGGDAVAYFDPDRDMGDVISHMLKNQSLRERYLHKGTKQLSKFSWDQTARLTHQVYEKVLA